MNKFICNAGEQWHSKRLSHQKSDKIITFYMNSSYHRNGKGHPPIHSEITNCFIKHVIRLQHHLSEVIICILKYG